MTVAEALPATGDLAPAERDPALWKAANRRLLAKAIAELSYEEAFSPAPAEGGRWTLRLASGAAYTFVAHRSIWGYLSVEPESVQRVHDGRSAPADDLFRFLTDARGEIDMAPADLAWYRRELLNTLIVDTRLLSLNAGLPLGQLARLPLQELHARLEGHPKAVTSKGRLGWGADDQLAYAPEFGGSFKLLWVAVAREDTVAAAADSVSEQALLSAALDRGERARLSARLAALGAEAGRMAILPVHPWQWHKTVAAWFAPERAAGRIVLLGAFGDRFRAQPSLRTISNATRLVPYDIKLSLSILNTSCYRGIPGRYIPIGPRLSDWLDRVVAADPLLGRDRRVLLLREVAGTHVPNPTFRAVEDVPYHYDEALGVIWRERIEPKLAADERAVMLSALHHCDDQGHPLMAEYVARSGLTAAAWTRKLFEAVTLPLYHLLCRYGLGFIAHGQNTTLLLRDWQPAGLILKDFQGDLDVVDRPFPELAGLPEDILGVLPRKRPEVIIHDIQTAHFVTVLRFVSAAAERSGLIAETDFYRILAETLRTYQARHPELAERIRLFDLFAPKMPRVCLNRTRFKIGYAESNARPLPILGGDLDNPLHLADPGPMPDGPGR